MAESRDARAQRTRRLLRSLDLAYPDARIALRFGNAFELLVATILSAQCTDEMVNRVTPKLFRRFATPRALADADPAEVEALVRPTGFYRQKTRSIQSAARDVAERFGGAVPRTMEELLTLRGVARKTANVVLGNAFDVPGIAVDTHVSRVSQRLELTRSEDPVAIEADLSALVPRERWTHTTHQLIHHGRVCCQARRPRCEECPLAEDCPWPGRAQRAAAPKAAARGARGPARAPTRSRRTARGHRGHSR
jgi:endonuclease-3